MTSPSSITIREATDADGEALSRLIAGVFAEYDGVLFALEEFPELQAVATAFAARGGRIWVAVEGERIVGSFGVAMTARPGVAEFFKVYLDRSLRGKGIARRLYEQALAFARAAGAEAITLWSDIKFVDGHRFYQRQGFVRMPGVRALHDVSQTLEIGFFLAGIADPAAREAGVVPAAS